MNKFYDTIQTPIHLKEKAEFEADHYFLCDGLMYEDIIAKQVNWLERILPHLK
jgi:hypothetical protein